MENIKKQIEKFEKETGVKLEINDGKPYYDGYLNLRCTGITSLPEGLAVGESLYLCGTGITSLPEGLAVGGYLYLEGCTGITRHKQGQKNTFSTSHPKDRESKKSRVTLGMGRKDLH